MANITMDKCKCVCDSAQIVTDSHNITMLEAGLIVILVLLVIVGLFIAFNKLKNSYEDDDEDE